MIKIVVVVVVVMLMMLEIIPTSPVSFYGCFAAILTINPHLKYFDAVSTFVFCKTKTETETETEI